MISIKIKSLMKFAEVLGSHEQQMNFASGCTVGEVIQILKKKFGTQLVQLLEVDDQDTNYWRTIICLNGRNIEFLDGTDTICLDGDELFFWTPLGGG